MSEALRKFVLKNAKTSKTFDKKFAGPQGTLALVDMLDGAPPDAQKAGMKVLRDNADDMEAAANKLRDMVYGPAEPVKKTGVQGKTSAPAERIEGNLPQNDRAVVGDLPKPKKKGKPTVEEESVATAQKSQAFQAEREAASAAAREPRGKRKAAAKKELEDSQATREVAAEETAPLEEEIADDAGDDTEIGQFVSAEGLSGVDGIGEVDVAGAGFMPPIIDPRSSMMVGAKPSPFANAFDMERFLSDPSLQGVGVDVAMNPADPMPNAPAPIEPKVNPLAAEQPGLSAADMEMLLGGMQTPSAAPAQLDLSDLIGGGTANPRSTQPSPAPMDMGMLAAAKPPPFTTNLGMKPGPDDPTLFPQPTPQDSPWRQMGNSPLPNYGPPASMAPPAPRPPFYDPNRTTKEWWNSPGPLSRANEFMYQRFGVPAGVARAVQPTASVLDKGLKIGGPAVVGLGAAYAGLKGLQALSGAGAGSAIAPPTSEEMSQTDAALAAAEARVRQMMQPPPKPASAPPYTPVQ
jgi:hypothetical protein